MELEDLVLKHYRVERIGNRMVAFEDPDGNYKADSAQEVEKALNTRRHCNVEVRTSNKAKWYPISNRR